MFLVYGTEAGGGAFRVCSALLLLVEEVDQSDLSNGLNCCDSPIYRLPPYAALRYVDATPFRRPNESLVVKSYSGINANVQTEPPAGTLLAA
jgi:hypothetical protein